MFKLLALTIIAAIGLVLYQQLRPDIQRYLRMRAM
jgi:hypothetical protein